MVIAINQHGPQHIFKLKIESNLGTADFCCKSLSLLVEQLQILSSFLVMAAIQND